MCGRGRKATKEERFAGAEGEAGTGGTVIFHFPGAKWDGSFGSSRAAVGNGAFYYVGDKDRKRERRRASYWDDRTVSEY